MVRAFISCICFLFCKYRREKQNVPFIFPWGLTQGALEDSRPWALVCNAVDVNTTRLV